ncbi:MAG: hypothetical protein U0Q18_27475 [Bryobacteraceae bacterium]
MRREVLILLTAVWFAAAQSPGSGEQQRLSEEGARVLFEKAVEHYPDFPEAQDGLARTLIAQNKAEAALPHSRKAIALNAEDEVAFYHLAQAYTALGNAAGQQQAPAEFRRLRGHRSTRRQMVKNVFAPNEATRQELEPDAAR